MADTGWEPVHDAAGKVVGWVASPDPGEPDLDYFEADRLPRVRRRADIIDQAAALLDPAFDLETSWEALEAALPDGDIDSAGNVVLLLEQIERGYPDR
jgi:hypothetical protein